MKTTTFCLNRQWKFTKEPQSVLPKVLSHNTVYSFAKGDGAQGPATFNFNTDDWQTVDLPHDFQHLEPYDKENGLASHGYQVAGKGWYRRTFLLNEEDREMDIALHFEGISGISDIYVNGFKVLHNESCYNGFEIPLTDIANFGVTPNVVAIMVDKTVWEGWWYEGCGINRPVWLIKRPLLHLAHDGVYVKPVLKDGTWQATVTWQLENTAPTPMQGVLHGCVMAPDGKVIATKRIALFLSPYSVDTKTADFPISTPLLWDLETPNRYTLLTLVESDTLQEETKTIFGLRTIAVNADTGFWLNGRNIKLLGTCNHQDHAGIGATIPKDLWRWRVKQLKEMGSNAYRCSHNPPPKALLEVCDELGMLVMDENRAFSTAKENMALLRSMVCRDRNHPCVIMYSLYNEEPLQGTAKGRRLAKHMANAVLNLDDTRPILGALSGGFFDKVGTADALDVTGINYSVFTFDDVHAMYPKQPIVSSETTSAFATRGCFVNDDQLHRFDNYDTHCAAWGETVREASCAVLSRPYVMGLFVWTGFDYRGEPTPHEWPSVSSHFGIMDLCGFRKDVYYLHQSYWMNTPKVYLTPHWNHQEGDTVRVMSYTNCEEIALYLNGDLISRQKADWENQNQWEVPFARGELRAVGYLADKPVATFTVRTANTPKKIVLASALPALYGDVDGIGVINLHMEDENGVFCPLENQRLRLSLQGGKIVGVGNGDPTNHDDDVSDFVRLFSGRAQVLFVPDETSREVTLTVDDEGTLTGTLTLPVLYRPAPPSLPPATMRMVTGWRMSMQAQIEKPTVKMAVPSDMNSLEPVTFSGTETAILTRKKDHWALFQTITDVGDPSDERFFVLNTVQGTVEVYAGTTLLQTFHAPAKARMEVPLPKTVSGETQITILLQNHTLDQWAGIYEPVALIVKHEKD